MPHKISKLVRKHPVLSSCVVITLVLVLGVYGISIKMERDAFALANAGRTATKVLGELAKDIKNGDMDGVLSRYDSSYGHKNQGIWREVLEHKAGEVAYFRWEEGQKRLVDKALMDQLMRDFVGELGSLEKAKFKLIGIHAFDNSQMTLKTAFWGRGKRENLVFDTKIYFVIDLVERDDQWTISSQQLLSGETVTGRGQGFVDVALRSGLAKIRLQHNPMLSEGPWEAKRFPIAKYSSSGVSACDYDQDGFEDLFFGNGRAAVLMRNRGDGQFEDATARAGLPTDLMAVNTALFVDLDNDGDKDLFLGRFSLANKLYENLGDGTFRDVSEGANLGANIVAVASASDYDNDGDLDLYLGRYLDPRVDLPTTPFYTRNGQSNTLLRNEGGFRFSDVTEEASVNDHGLTLGATWADFDDDGDQDLYLANDFGRNTFFENQGDGTFRDVTEENGTIDVGFGMSADWGDANNDGALDLYVANVHSGQRWYGQAATLKNYMITSFRQGTFFADLSTYYELYRHLGSRWSQAGDHIIRGNSLLLNDGKGHFKDVSVASNSNPFGWYWSSAFFDYDNDGRLDVYSANGWISSSNKDDF